MSPPIRTAIIGLSSSAATNWAAAAHLPCLISPTGQTLFSIISLCNSSPTAASNAISTYNLDASTVKPYGDPDSLAADRAIDLVLCNTRVDKHLETVLPSLLSGKDVYIEWPIACNKSQIDELIAAAALGGGRVAIGLQGRFAPPVLKVKEVLESGRVGKLLSTEVRIFGGTRDREILPIGLKYFAEKNIGGNPIVIGFGHVIDYIQSVVGDIIPGTDEARTQIQRPDIRVRDPQTDTIVESIRSDVPDLLSLHGSLPESPHIHANASLIAYFLRGQPYPGDPSLSWTLTGEKGTIRLTAPAGISLQADAYAEPVTIAVHQFDTDKVEMVPWAWSERQMEVPTRARSVQHSLISFANADESGYVSLEDAARRAGQIEGWFKC
ncbi:NAD(P)-binding protein [Penicillium verhagenii]|uniref:NAD(P)-binding protein n=1 Tax=Penicillium verhagenii TaxID=1562060 RepID=UPI002545255A|nr:NAD(P)-binding protein [Penicillium verhagenii]KAJ5938840.1 NAD(P)-binding protein [Penicillium verhagenii]